MKYVHDFNVCHSRGSEMISPWSFNLYFLMTNEILSILSWIYWCFIPLLLWSVCLNLLILFYWLFVILLYSHIFWISVLWYIGCKYVPWIDRFLCTCCISVHCSHSFKCSKGPILDKVFFFFFNNTYLKHFVWEYVKCIPVVLSKIYWAHRFW